MSNSNIFSGILQRSNTGDNNFNVINDIYNINLSKDRNEDLYIKVLELFEKSKIEISQNNCEEIFHLAKIKPTELARCNELLKKNINIKNCLSFWKFAEKNGNKEISSVSEQFVLENFMEITKEDDFLKLSAENLKKILSSDNLNIDSEDYALKSLKKWYEDDNNKRNEYCQLLQEIRFTNLPIQYYFEIVVHELDNCNLCEEKKRTISNWYIYPDKIRPIYEFNTDSRRYYDETLLQISTNDNLEYISIEEYNPKSKSWSELRPIKPNIKYSCVKILDGKLIFLGGHVLPSNDVTKENWCMDFRLTFNEIGIAPMLQERIFFEAVVKDKQLLVFGGMDNDRNEINSAEIWNSLNNEWQNINKMNQPRYHPSGVLYEGEAYVFGGYNKNEYLKSFEVYNFKENNWTLYPPKNDIKNIKCFDYCHIKSTILDEYIYVYECFKESSTYEHHLKCFNPKISKTEWYILPEIPSPQECRYLIAHQRKIIFFGSEKNYEYNPEKKEWREFSSQKIIDNYNHIFSVPKSNLCHKFIKYF